MLINWLIIFDFLQREALAPVAEDQILPVFRITCIPLVESMRAFFSTVHRIITAGFPVAYIHYPHLQHLFFH